MADNSPHTGKVRFADVELDLATGEIYRQGQRQHLPDQAFEVLALLIARHGELATRDELIAALWPKTTFIDTDAGLNTAVKKLRAALGDDADEPRYVETVPRRGYRFTGELLTHSPQETPLNLPPLRRAPRRLLWLPLAIAGAVALAGIALWQLRSTPNNMGAPVASNPVVMPGNNIAVLPFVNLTGNAKNDFLALSLSENILHRLAQQNRIGVIARTSSFEVQGSAHDIREIGRKLNARFVLEGSLQATAAYISGPKVLIECRRMFSPCRTTSRSSLPRPCRLANKAACRTRYSAVAPAILMPGSPINKAVR